MGWIGNKDIYNVKSPLDKKDRLIITDRRTLETKQTLAGDIADLARRASFIAEFDASPLDTTFTNPLFAELELEEIQAFDENGVDILRKPEASKPSVGDAGADTITYTNGFDGKYLFILDTTGNAFVELARKWAMNPEDVPVLENPNEFSALHWAHKAKDAALSPQGSFIFSVDFGASPVFSYQNPLLEGTPLIRIQAFSEQGVDVLRHPTVSKVTASDTIDNPQGFVGVHRFVLGAEVGITTEWGLLIGDPLDNPKVEAQVTQSSDNLVTSGGVFAHTQNFVTDAQVSTNADVAANTAARHDAVTLVSVNNIKVPTEAEWDEERLTWSSNDAAGAFNSPLKLPVAGFRDPTSSGIIFGAGIDGIYWSSTVFDNLSVRIGFNNSTLVVNPIFRGAGYSIRLIVDGIYTQQQFDDEFLNKTITLDGLTYGYVYNPVTEKVWLDRNLGASQIASSSTDLDSYGWLYQWGRATDGHQLRTSNTTTSPATSPQPPHGDFIINNTDWLASQNDNLWQGVDGENTPASSNTNYLSIVGQVITKKLISLVNHVTGRLGFGNLQQGSAHSILGKADTGVGDVDSIAIDDNRIVGRISGSDVKGLTDTEVKQLLSLDNVDNTSDADKPISTATQAALDAIELKGSQYIYVYAKGTDIENAQELQAAYDEAKTMSPSATNRITVICGAGNYNFETDVFIMDTQYIDLVSLDGNRSIVFNAPLNTSNRTEGSINVTANDVFVKGVDVQDKNFRIGDNLNLLKVENCKGDDFSFGGAADFGGTFLIVSGTFTNCIGGWAAFGGFATASGTFNNCVGGDFSFGGFGGTASGVFINCEGGTRSFGGDSGVASGVFTDCVGGNGSFGGDLGTASGVFANCEGGFVSFGGFGTASGVFNNCIGGDSSFGGFGTLSGKLYRCQLTSSTFETPTGNGKIVLGIDGNDNIINQTA